MPEPLTLRQRQALQTRRLLLASAERVFASRGYSDSTIDDVAREAGASKGAIYHHFSNKHELFRALLQERTAGIESLSGLARGAQSLEDVADRLVDAWFTRTQENPDALKLSLESRLQAIRDPATAELLGNYYRELRRALADLLQSAAGQLGESQFRPHCEVVVFSLLDSLGQHSAIDPAAIDLQNVREILTQVLTDQLRQ